MVTKSLKQVHNLLNHMPSEKGVFHKMVPATYTNQYFFAVSATRSGVNLTSNSSTLLNLNLWTPYPSQYLNKSNRLPGI